MIRETIMAAATAAALLATGTAAHAATPAGESEAHAILRELLSIDTTYDKGTAAAVDKLRARFLAAGFAPGDLTVVADPAHPEQVNMFVRLKGSSAAPPLLYLCHLDVVAAKPEDWTVPPFRFTEKDGWIYGRGSLDMKGEDANAAAALLRLKREGYVPTRDLVIAFTANEEGGGAEGVGWLMKAHPELMRAGLVLNPDAGSAAFLGGKRAFYGFQTSEKVYVTFQAETTNRGGHSSEPRPDNAIYSLVHGLNRLADDRFPARLTPTVKAFYAAQAQFATGQRRADMEAVGRGDLAAADRLSADPTDNAQVRTTCTPTMMEAGHADNALPQRARVSIQCRMLPGDTEAEVGARLAKVLADPAIHLTVSRAASPSPESPPTPAISATFAGVVHSMWPGLTVTPSMDAGASDSKYTRNAGLPSYGAVSIFTDLEDYRAHGRDERISSARFEEGAEFAYRLMKAFGSFKGP